jgi:hypothetical protein
MIKQVHDERNACDAQHDGDLRVCHPRPHCLHLNCDCGDSNWWSSFDDEYHSLSMRLGGCDCPSCSEDPCAYRPRHCPTVLSPHHLTSDGDGATRQESTVILAKDALSV